MTAAAAACFRGVPMASSALDARHHRAPASRGRTASWIGAICSTSGVPASARGGPCTRDTTRRGRSCRRRRRRRRAPAGNRPRAAASSSPTKPCRAPVGKSSGPRRSERCVVRAVQVARAVDQQQHLLAHQGPSCLVPTTAIVAEGRAPATAAAESNLPGHPSIGRCVPHAQPSLPAPKPRGLRYDARPGRVAKARFVHSASIRRQSHAARLGASSMRPTPALRGCLPLQTAAATRSARLGDWRRLARPSSVSSACCGRHWLIANTWHVG